MMITMERKQTVLSFEGVYLNNKNIKLLNNINFTVNDGDRIAIIGPNGCGKSTLLRTIIRELKHTQGRIYFKQNPIESIPAKERAKQIALLSQIDVPDLRLTLEEYVALGLLPHVANSKDKHIIMQSIQDLGLSKIKHVPLEKLSGGQRQRAALARALSQKPHLLLLDEPTNHLDPLARNELLSLVKKQDTTIIAVLHDLQLAAAFANKVLMLNEGHQIIFDSPDKVLQSEIIFPLFGLECYSVVHPKTGKAMKIFDTPIQI